MRSRRKRDPVSIEIDRKLRIDVLRVAKHRGCFAWEVVEDAVRRSISGEVVDLDQAASHHTKKITRKFHYNA